jgi:hypothetical protein
MVELLSKGITGLLTSNSQDEYPDSKAPPFASSE